MSEATKQQANELTIEDARPCVKGVCELRVASALFNRGFYVACGKCKKSAGIDRTEVGAVETWNRWLEIGNGRI